MIDFTELDRFVGGLKDEHLGFLFREEGARGLSSGSAIRSGLGELRAALSGFAGGGDLFSRFTIGAGGIGLAIEGFEKELADSGLSGLERDRLYRLLDIILARHLAGIAADRDRVSHPQNLRHILSYFSERKAELLLIVRPLLRIIADEKHFAIQERARAGRGLVANYPVETLFIYLSLDPAFTLKEKEFIFSWLIAYQKVVRKIQEILYDKRDDKSRAAEEWFGRNFKVLKKEGRVPTDDHKVPPFITGMLTELKKGNEGGVTDACRALTLVVNNEDLLRMVLQEIAADPWFEANPSARFKLYRTLHDVMADYRCIGKGECEARFLMEDTFTAFSQEIRESEYLVAARHEQKGKTPVLGARGEYGLLPETIENLGESNLSHLFDIWPIPPLSQKVFNTVCQLKSMIPGGREYEMSHLLYREKVLEFLMRLERMGIKVIKGDELPLITNSVQLEAINFFQEGVYLGSTGHWNAQNRKPPSVICCSKPHALGNCVGHNLRHIVLRVFLGTGEFYESPFVLDSTQRFGRMDEEAGVEALLMRPGLFLLSIPDAILPVWKRQQQRQMDQKLGKMIEERIHQEAG